MTPNEWSGWSLRDGGLDWYMVRLNDYPVFTERTPELAWENTRKLYPEIGEYPWTSEQVDRQARN